MFADLINTYQNTELNEFLRLFLGNIGWFFPFGFLFPIMTDKKNPIIIVAAGMMFSFFIETAQFILYKGVAELDDLILNTLGTFIGYLLYRLLQHIILKVKA